MKFDRFWGIIMELRTPQLFRTIARSRQFKAWYYPGLYAVNSRDGLGNPDPPQYGVVGILSGKGLIKWGNNIPEPPKYRDASWVILKREFNEVWNRAMVGPASEKWKAPQYATGSLSNNRTMSYILPLIKHFLGNEEME